MYQRDIISLFKIFQFECITFISVSAWLFSSGYYLLKLTDVILLTVDSMVKDRPETSGAGESSGSQGRFGYGGRGGYPPQRPTGSGVPQQQGGGAGRGWAPISPQQSQQGGRDGGGYYYQGRGSRPQPRDVEFAAQFQYQARGGPQTRGGMPPQQQLGGRQGGHSMAGRRGVGPSFASPSRALAPELHQATQAPYQATQPGSFQASSSSQQDASVADVVQQFQQHNVQDEASSSESIVPVVPPASSNKSMKFPARPGKGISGVSCVVKANHFFAELPDKDLHQYDVSFPLFFSWMRFNFLSYFPSLSELFFSLM